MRIALGADHRGFDLKRKLMTHLVEDGYECVDFGTDSDASCDYPDIAYKVAHTVIDGCTDVGILVDGNGIGMSITANKLEGIRAATCHDELTARMSREHNQANILCLGSELLSFATTLRITRAWLDTDFDAGGRHERRVGKITRIEQGHSPTGQTASADHPSC